MKIKKIDNAGNVISCDGTVKIGNFEDESLLELARVGFIDGEYEVYVHTNDPGDIPHVHIRDVNSGGKEFETCVRLDKPEYFFHGKYKKQMNRMLVKKFFEFMNKIPPKAKRLNSNYEFAVEMWNNNNSNADVVIKYKDEDETQPIIPNYLDLNK